MKRFELKQLIKEIINEVSGDNIFYHGSTDKLFLGKKGIHVGTKLAATQALEAKIGVPATGEWDGTREYGKTLLAGQDTLRKMEKEGKLCNTGFNCLGPKNDYLPTERKEKATYSNLELIPFNCKPIVFKVKIIGKMTNTIETPHSDNVANGLIYRQLKTGVAKSGYYYKNIGEDEGSISAVVPNKSFLEIL